MLTSAFLHIAIQNISEIYVQWKEIIRGKKRNINAYYIIIWHYHHHEKRPRFTAFQGETVCWAQTTGMACSSARPSIGCTSCTRRSSTTWTCSCTATTRGLAACRSLGRSTASRSRRFLSTSCCTDDLQFLLNLPSKQCNQLLKVFKYLSTHHWQDRKNSNQMNVPGRRGRGCEEASFCCFSGCRADDQLWSSSFLKDRKSLLVRCRSAVSGKHQPVCL